MVHRLFLTWCVFNILVCFYGFCFYLLRRYIVLLLAPLLCANPWAAANASGQLTWLSSLIVNIKINLENLLFALEKKGTRFVGCKVTNQQEVVLFCYYIIILTFSPSEHEGEKTLQVKRELPTFFSPPDPRWLGSSPAPWVTWSKNVGGATSLPVLKGYFSDPPRPPLCPRLTSCVESHDVWMKCSSSVLFFTKAEICDIFQRIYNKYFIDHRRISACVFI